MASKLQTRRHTENGLLNDCVGQFGMSTHSKNEFF